jgi:hypothetical protein
MKQKLKFLLRNDYGGISVTQCLSSCTDQNSEMAFNDRFQSLIRNAEIKRQDRIDPAFSPSIILRWETYFLNLLTPANPTRPKPRSSMVAGSGTDEVTGEY